MPSIWYLNHYAAFPDYPGPTRHFELSKRLAAQGHDITLVASEFDSTKGVRLVEEGQRRHVVERDGVRFIWLRTSVEYRANNASRVGNMLEFSRALRREGRTCFGGVAPRPDVIIGSTPHLLTPWIAWRLSKRWRAPFVLEVRDLWPETFVAFGLFPMWHPVVLSLRVLERLLYRRADRIVTLLPEAWRYISRHGVPRERIEWVPNGVTVRQEPPTRPGQADQPLTLMYVGTMARANVLDDLIRAAAILQDRGVPVRIALLGDGREKEALVGLAKKLHLSNVEFRGMVPRNQVDEAAADADGFVALLEDTDLYQYGTSLNKVFDYMATGKSVILAGKMAHNYIERSGGGITLPPRDPKALAEAIEQWATMPPRERRAMGARGRAYVETHHDWDLLAARLNDMLMQTIRQRATG